MKRISIVAASALMVATVASAEWHYGIGTGLTRLHVEGDQGLNVRVGGIGPVEFDVDLEPDDISDLMETAFGFGGYATDGQWMFQFASGFLELRDGTSRTLPSGTRVAGEIFQEITLAEASVGYVVHRTENLTVTPYVGVRYLEHEIGVELDVTTAGGTASEDRSVDHDWTDARVGVTLSAPITETWTWDGSVEAGFGGSDGTYKGDTGISWMFAKHWSARAGFNYTAIDFENGSRGDDDWYLYDADEYGASLGALYHW